MPKKLFREEYLSKRRKLSPIEWENKSKLIQENAIRFIQWDTISKIGLYSNLSDEVGTGSLFDYAKKQSKCTAYPKVTSDHRIQYYIIEWQSELAKGTIGIKEPLSSKRMIETDALDLIIVPGLAFDRAGFRLGYGRGYFDRLLVNIDSKKIVALAFDFQIVESLPNQSHDKQVGTIVTESGVIECGMVR